jgi:hypothetical protein
MAAAAKMRMAGQICASPTRFIAHRSVYADFVELLRRGRSAPCASATVSPPACRWVRSSTPPAGRHPFAGGRRQDARRARRRRRPPHRRQAATSTHPTVLADVPLDADAMTSEPFGPLGCAFRSPPGRTSFRLALANKLSVGLSAYAFTNTLHDAERICARTRMRRACRSTGGSSARRAPTHRSAASRKAASAAKAGAESLRRLPGQQDRAAKHGCEFLTHLNTSASSCRCTRAHRAGHVRDMSNTANGNRPRPSSRLASSAPAPWGAASRRCAHAAGCSVQLFDMPSRRGRGAGARCVRDDLAQGVAKGRCRRKTRTRRSPASAGQRAEPAGRLRPGGRGHRREAGGQAGAVPHAGGHRRPDCILATNTSSLSVTAIAAACSNAAARGGLALLQSRAAHAPGGSHPGAADRTDGRGGAGGLSKRVGHRAVVTSDSPGFVVNHAGRAFVTEGLKLLAERAPTTRCSTRSCAPAPASAWVRSSCWT